MKCFSTPLQRIISVVVLAIACWSSAYATTFTVTNLNDSGVGSLRQAIINANAGGAGPHTINFAMAGTILINSGLPAIANTGITINGGGIVTINAQGGDINRDIFTINASNTTIKGFTVQNTGSNCFTVAANLSGVTIQDIIANHTAAFINNIIYVGGASTNMTIKNLLSLTGMQDCSGLVVGRAIYFAGGSQNNLLIEDVTIYALCEGIVFRDASANTLNIINTTVYGAINHIVFDNTGGPVETANNVTIDGENTASLYSQRDGGSEGMIYSDFVNTSWQIKNLVVDADRANTADDSNYGIRFDNTTNGVTIDNVTIHDVEIYSLWFNAAATNITIQNSTIDNFDGFGTAQLLRFESTISTLNITNTLIDLDNANTTNDADYGIVFGYGVAKSNININGLTINEADVDGIYFDGPVTNFTMTNSTFTKNYDGVEFYNGYTRSNVNITNSTFTGSGRSGLLMNMAGTTTNSTISGNTISNNTASGLWLYSGNGNKGLTVSNNTISYNGGAGIYVNSGPDAINITQNSIFKNTGNGIELDGGGNLSYEGANRPTVTGSSETAPNSGDYNVTFSLPTICNAAGGCTVQIFANASSDDVEGHYYVQEFTGLAAGTHNKLVDLCAVAPCLSLPTGFWTATLKVVATGSVSEFSNKQTMKTQGPAAVNAGVALWLDAQDALSGNLPGGTGWQDRSGNDRDFDLVFGTPNRGTSGLNYNHYVQFNGGSYLRSSKSPFVNGFTAGEAIVVTRAYYRHINNGNPYDLGGSSRAFHYSWGNEAVYNGFGTTQRLGWQPSTNNIVEAKAGVSSVSGTRLDVRSWNIFQTYSAAGAWGTGFNGQFVATTATNTPSFALAGGNEHIGAVSGYTFYGDVAEVIMYSRTLTTAERARVNSYLALKYGTTLDQTVATNYVASDGTTNMWVNDGDAYKWNIFGIGKDNASGLHQKQSESIEQNAILSVGIGSTIATTNDLNSASIATDKSFLTFADDNQLQRFGPAVTATNSNFRMHRTWKTDKFNFADANVTFQFGPDFGGNYLLLSSNNTFTGITSEILLDSMGRATFNSSLLAHGSFFSVGAKMQLPGCVSPPVVSYPNYQEYYNAVAYPFPGAGGIGYGYNTNPATQSNENNIAFSGYYGRNFTNSFACDNCEFVYRAKLTVPSNGSYTFYITSDDNSDVRVNGQYVAGVVTCCYTSTGTISLTAGTHDIEVRQAEGGGGDYVTVEYSGPSIGRQVIPVTALTNYTAPGVQTWLKADAGVVNSGGVTRWNDVSGNNNDAYQTNASFNPTYNSGNAINFNPAVNAATGAGMLFKKTIPPTSNLTMFAVGKSASPAVRTLANGTWFNAATNDHFILFDGSNNFAYFDGNNVGWKYSGQTITTNQAYLVGMSHNAAANTAQPRLNGKNGTVLTNINEDEVDYYQQFLNFAWQGGNQGAGDVAEFVAVSGTLTATDIQKIESYLALKYGITIDQTTPRDYLASNGSTTMWKASDNTGYNKDIAGIGKDLCQNLHQKQSKSVNTGSLVTMAVGSTIATTNAANAASVTADNSFLTWASNGLATTFLTNVIGNATVNLRMARVWKADKTNWTDGSITVNLTGGNAQNYLVISNADPAFAAANINQVLQLNANGSVTFSSSLLQDGAYFTFGKRIVGPACVNAGIAAWWRADDNAVDSLWQDYSGNQKNAVQATVANRPTLTANGVNFNPAFDFDGTNDVFTTSSLITSTGINNVQVYAVAITENIQVSNLFTELSSNGYYLNVHLPWVDNNLYWDAPYGYRYAAAWGGTVNTPYLWSFLRSPTNMEAFRNRTSVGGPYNAAFANIAGNNSPFNIGGVNGTGNFNGKIAEMIVYNNSSATTATQRQQIESYLSLKYGITLNQTTATDYLASNGSKMWDATVNSIYKTDIAGIGKDVCTGLHQKQSKSVNTGNLITMATGSTLAASNQVNANAVTNDLSFLVWGHNNLSTSFGPTVTGVANATARMSRVWRVDKTNWADQNITICTGQSGDRYLLVNAADATFGAGTTEYTMSFSTGCVTLNSSALADGAYFTMGTKIVGPACVNTGIALWLRADYGASGAQWSDYSGNRRNAVQANAANQPAVLSNGMNYNPAFNFDAAINKYLQAPSVFGTNPLTNAYFFLASTADGTGNGNAPFGERMNNGQDINPYIYNAGQVFWDFPFGWRISTAWGGNVGVPNLWTFGRTTALGTISRDGRQITSAAGAFTGVSGTNSAFEVGRRLGGTYYHGKISEMVVYTSAPTAAEQKRIESYLALKYGVTLDQTAPTNYLATNASVYWDATANSSYKTNIAGIGRDDCTDLEQKQSKSINTGEILAVALGSSIEVSNLANTNTITTDRSFLVWGNNNGLNEFTTQVTGTNVTSVLGRVWRVDKTNWGDQNITLCFDNYADDTYLLISDASSTFATINQEKQLSALGCVTFNSSQLPDGAYFSLGKRIQAPGCVTAGIVTWLDAQDVASGNMTDGVGWADKSGNNKYFNTVTSDPARVDAALNYNHVINFDGNDFLQSTQSPFVNTFTSGEAIVITKSNGQFNGQGNPYDFGSGNRNSHYSWGDSHFYNGFGTTDRLGFDPQTNTIIDGKPGVASITGTNYSELSWNLMDNYSAANDWAVGFNGLFKATTATNTVSFALTAGNEYIANNGANAYNGDIAEVVLYRRKLTAPERQKVMSYLALKYGITLDQTVTDQDYVATDGSNMWDWSDNVGYRNDIAGVGRDTCQKLNQKQSKSINGDDPLAIAVGNFTTFPVSNEANATTITNDKSFLVWSNNNGALTFTTAVPKVGINGTFRTVRAWKIDKNNFANQMLTISVAQTGERYLLVDEDGSGGFENDANTKEYTFDFTTGLLNISSLNLPDGAVIALGTKISGPACVNGGIKTWYRADYGAIVSNWSDFSGNSNTLTQSTLANQPDLNSSLNFNPVMDFTPNDFMSDANGIFGTSTYTSSNVFVVQINDQIGINQSTFYENISGSAFGALIPWSDGNVYWDPPVSTNRISGAWGSAINVPNLWSLTSNTAGAGVTTGRYIYRNRTLIPGSTATAPAAFTGNNSIFYLGSAAGTQFSNLKIAEIAVYGGQITNVERLKIESYLSLKYGITLDQTTPTNYVASDWNGISGTTIWNATTNTGYNSNIAGIGLDICTELNQKQSKSVNAGEILTVALGDSVAASNLNNPKTVTNDLSFLVWGHNNGVNDFTNTVTATGTTSMASLGRVWKAQKTNWVNQNITLCFTGYDADEYLLVSNASATFATVNTEQALNATGCVTINSSLLPDGAFFTLGKNIQGPACVDGGIKLWLRADDGTVADSLWADYSGNANNAFQNTAANRPTPTDNSINFNPAVVFDGVNTDANGDWMDIPNFTDIKSSFWVVKNNASDNDFDHVLYSPNLSTGSWMHGGTGTLSWTGNGMNADANNVWRKDGGTADQNTQYDDAPNSKPNLVSFVSTNRNVTADFISFQAGTPTRKWNGPIAEIVLYNKALSATERQQVESYLSLKYGITLNNGATDYLASDASNIWDASDNTGYGNDIAGLGKDICTNLHQKQSKSVNSDALITMAVGPAVAASNAGNPNAVTTDKSFLVWSNNNLATTFTIGFTKTGFPNVNQRTPRIWKVDKTNWADQDITICVGQTGERYLLIDNGGDADFADDGESSVHALNFGTGCVTINSSLLPDGAHFSLGTEISGPACVNSNIKTWYRADYGASVGSWSDYSGNSNTVLQATIANQPDLSSIVNFNPVMDFNPNDFMSDANGIFGASTYTSSNVFVVQVNDQAGVSQSTLFESTTAGQFNAHIPFSDGNIYWDPALNNRIAGAWGGSLNIPQLWSMTSNTAGTGVTTGRFVYRNRTLIPGSTTTAPAAFSGNNSTFFLGSGPNTSFSNIKIAEVAVYGGQMTDAERLRVESYLSLKYGTTLDQTTNTDYVASNGTTKMWTNDNDNYESDIAGIGKDECTNLHQKQSASVNTGNIVTVALGGTVEASNTLNANSITNDLSFLSWAHNNGTVDFTTTAPGSNATARLARVWKVDKTNWADQNITICFGATYANNYLITNATDGTFPTVDLEYQLDANGCYTLNSSDLANGAFFTVGKNIEGPACVNGGIRVWLDANDGLTAITNGFQWNDKSNNNLHVAQTVDAREAVEGTANAAHNFNKYIDFDGNDVFETDEQVLLSATSSGSVFFVSQYQDLSGYDSPVDFDADDPHLGRLNSNMVTYMNGSSPVQFSPAALTLTTTRTHLSGFLWNGGTNGGMEMRRDALSATDPLMDFNNIGYTKDFGVGAYISGVEGIDGTMSEVIVYNRKLTAAETQRVESYLALKYGITLDQTTATNYLASDGTIYWDGTTNSAYNKDVAGLGKDDCTNLHQKQSKSVNANSLITIATGSAVATTNVLNTIAVTNDKSFFVWGNNGLATTFSTVFALTGGQSTARTPRIWQVNKTNWQDQDITICVGQTGERYLLIDDGGDADFANDTESTEYALNFTTGCVTINSSLLPDGAHFSLGTKIAGPACVNTGITTWLRADYGATGAQWTDFSGNSRNATQSTMANQAVLTASATNFNPAMTFNASKNYDFVTGLASTDASTFIFVSRTNTIDGNYQTLAELGNDRPGLYWRSGRANNYTFDVTTPDMHHPTVFTASNPAIFTFTSNNANTKDFTIGANGLQEFYTGADGTYSLGTGATGAKLGALNSGAATNFNGDMNEVVVYNRVLTALERQQVESYLALKYGITLSTNTDGDGTPFETISGSITEGDYVASNGTTIYWDASANTGYNSNIAGIGQDMCTELYQKQSKSVNAGEILTVALGSAVAASNAANTNTVNNDLSFLTWGHNNGVNDFTQTVPISSTTSMAYLGRVWKADKTNWADQDITLCFTGYDDDNYLLISNASATFATVDLEQQLEATGCVTINSSLLPDGAFFSLGKVQQGPACVDGGIKMWLRADDGTATGATWSDASGNGVDATQGTVLNQPVLNTNSFNFNPALDFNGTTHNMLVNAGTFPTGTANRTAFVVSSTDNTAFKGAFSYGGAVSTANVSFSLAHTAGNAYTSGHNTLANDAGPAAGYILNGPPVIQRGGYNGTQSNAQVNGGTIATKTFAINTGNTQGYIGTTRFNAAGEAWDGEIAEVIIYNKVLTAAETQRIQSYLALKYGITIDQSTDTDYLASDGTTTMWDNDGDNFENDIAGLGKDICTNLHQKQSKSVNTDDLVTFALGSSVAASNALNTNSVTTDKSFFSWANDNGATNTFATAVTTAELNVDLRMARVWKVDKTANWTDQDVTLCFNGQIGERYLVIDDNSATMASVNQTIALNPITGCVTFNTSNLQNGYYFSLATKILAPGCADNVDVLTWVRGDYAATVSQWNDFSGQARHAQQLTLANQPATTGVINFNPALDFNGSNYLTFDIAGQNLDINNLTPDRDPITVLTVYNADVASRPLWGNDDGGEDRYLDMNQVGNGTAATAYTGGNVIGQSKLTTTILDEGATNGSFVYTDGAQVLNFTQSGSNGGFSYTMLGRGKSTQGAGTMFDGRIGEYVVYRGALTSTQRQQAESYLALKYGITLNNGTTNYIASDGSNIWNATNNAGYNFNIAGIGRDDCPVLEQKQSRSANTNSVLTVALGITVQTTNAANINSVSNDLSFFTWGSDNGALAFSNAVTGTNVTTRLARTWKMDKTNWADQDVTLCFSGYDNKSYLLVSNTSSTFATLNVEQLLTAGGCITINTGLILDGAYLTLGQNLKGPACVATNIQLWLRADDGTASGAAWNDVSGNALNATQGTGGNQPTTTGSMNFNPALLFDGSDDHMSLAPLANLPYGATDRTIITVGYSTNTVGNRWIFSYGSPATSQGNFWGQQGTTGNYGGIANDLTSANYWTASVPALTANTYNGTTATIYKDGKSIASTAKTWNTVQSQGYIGRQIGSGEYWQGGIGEVVVYNRVLTAPELKAVNSYLALKYGITLDQTPATDYVASDNSVVWNATTNVAYKNNIAGIGRDDCSSLNQKQSKSANANTRLTMGLGSIAATNAANTSIIANDKSFMVWGDDNGAFTEISTDLPTSLANTNKRLTREWKIDKTGTPGNVQVKLDLTTLTITGTVAADFKLLVDADGDGDFATGTVTTFNATSYTAGIVTFDNVNFNDGEVFTLATKLPNATLAVKAFLQGAAIGAPVNTMRNDLQLYGVTYSEPDILPTTDPYQGTSTYSQINDPTGPAGALVDWVEVQIRSAANPNIILERQSLLLQTDGDIVDATGGTPIFNVQVQNVQIVVRHRNHLAIMSNSVSNFTGPKSYDFTTSLAQAFKFDVTDPDPMVLVNGKWTMWAGDSFHDAYTDANDIGSVNADFALGLYGLYLITDTNMDGFVDANDYSLTNTNFGIGTYSPLSYYIYP